jgi:hypothetical protein
MGRPVTAQIGNDDAAALRGQQRSDVHERIQELEKQHPEASKIEALTARALVLARQIDEIRCSSANDLTDLLAK